MGFFSRSSKSAPGAPLEGRKEVIVVGDEYFSVVRALSAGAVDGVTLEPEPGNQHDKNAVLVRVNGSPAGYLSAARAAAYRPMVTGQHRVQALVKKHPMSAPGLALFVLLPPSGRHD